MWISPAPNGRRPVSGGGRRKRNPIQEATGEFVNTPNGKPYSSSPVGKPYSKPKKGPGKPGRLSDPGYNGKPYSKRKPKLNKGQLQKAAAFGRRYP